jgi:hypothetical protein
VNWDSYVAPVIARMLPMSVHTFTLLVGVVEISAAVVVAIRPRIGAYIVAAWLWLIIINLLLVPGYYDIALRDFRLPLGALALGRLSVEFDRGFGKANIHRSHARVTTGAERPLKSPPRL